MKLTWDGTSRVKARTPTLSATNISEVLQSLQANAATPGSDLFVTPTFDERGNIVGYHSNRRKPDPAQIERIKPIYKALCAEEARHANAKDGMRASFEMMVGLLKQNGVAYDEFVLSL